MVAEAEEEAQDMKHWRLAGQHWAGNEELLHNIGMNQMYYDRQTARGKAAMSGH